MTKSISHLRAILFALIGYSFWVATDSILKILSVSLLPKYEILLFINLGSVITAASIALLRGRKKHLRPRKPLLLLVLGALMLMTVVTLIAALKHVPLVMSYIVIFTGPMITALLAGLFLKERIGLLNMLAIIAGFGGVVIALDPLNVATDPSAWLSYLAVFASVFSYTIYMLLLRAYGKDQQPEVLVLYPRLVAGIAGLLGCLVWHYEPITPSQLALTMVGGFCAAVGWLFVTIASQKALASIIAPYRYSQIITGALFGYFLWHEMPSWNLAAGAVIIILSGLYIAHHTRKGADILEKQDI